MCATQIPGVSAAKLEICALLIEGQLETGASPIIDVAFPKLFQGLESLGAKFSDEQKAAIRLAVKPELVKKIKEVILYSLALAIPGDHVQTLEDIKKKDPNALGMLKSLQPLTKKIVTEIGAEAHRLEAISQPFYDVCRPLMEVSPIDRFSAQLNSPVLVEFVGIMFDQILEGLSLKLNPSQNAQLKQQMFGTVNELMQQAMAADFHRDVREKVRPKYTDEQITAFLSATEIAENDAVNLRAIVSDVFTENRDKYVSSVQQVRPEIEKAIRGIAGALFSFNTSDQLEAAILGCAIEKLTNQKIGQFSSDPIQSSQLLELVMLALFPSLPADSVVRLRQCVREKLSQQVSQEKITTMPPISMAPEGQEPFFPIVADLFKDTKSAAILEELGLVIEKLVKEKAALLPPASSASTPAG